MPFTEKQSSDRCLVFVINVPQSATVEECLPLSFKGSFGRFNDQIDIRQINKRKANVFIYLMSTFICLLF